MFYPIMNSETKMTLGIAVSYLVFATAAAFAQSIDCKAKADIEILSWKLSANDEAIVRIRVSPNIGSEPAFVAFKYRIRYALDDRQSSVLNEAAQVADWFNGPFTLSLTRYLTHGAPVREIEDVSIEPGTLTCHSKELDGQSQHPRSAQNDDQQESHPSRPDYNQGSLTDASPAELNDLLTAEFRDKLQKMLRDLNRGVGLEDTHPDEMPVGWMSHVVYGREMHTIEEASCASYEDGDKEWLDCGNVYSYTAGLIKPVERGTSSGLYHQLRIVFQRLIGQDHWQDDAEAGDDYFPEYDSQDQTHYTISRSNRTFLLRISKDDNNLGGSVDIHFTHMKDK